LIYGSAMQTNRQSRLPNNDSQNWCGYTIMKRGIGCPSCFQCVFHVPFILHLFLSAKPMSKKNMNDPSESDFDLDSFLNGTDAPDQLEEKEFEKLEFFLESQPGSMHMEILDGFFCALICGPDATGPEEFTSFIFGGKEPQYKSPEQAVEVQEALRQHWDHIEGMMRNSDSYYIFMYSDDDLKVSANDWALGFALGVDKYQNSWRELLDQAGRREGLLVPFLTLYMEKHPQNTEGLIHAEEREGLVTELIENLPKIYHHFDEDRDAKRQGKAH